MFLMLVSMVFFGFLCLTTLSFFFFGLMLTSPSAASAPENAKSPIKSTTMPRKFRRDRSVGNLRTIARRPTLVVARGIVFHVVRFRIFLPRPLLASSIVVAEYHPVQRGHHPVDLRVKGVDSTRINLRTRLQGKSCQLGG